MFLQSSGTNLQRSANKKQFNKIYIKRKKFIEKIS